MSSYSYTASDFYKDELLRLENKKANVDSIMNSQDRLAKLNEGYRKRYAKYVEIVIVLIILYALNTGIVLLHRNFSDVIPEFIVDLIKVLIIFYAGYYLFTAYLELSTRSLINYDEIDSPAYDSSGIDVSKLVEDGMVLKSTENPIDTCVGEECCPGRFDSTIKRCVVGNTVPKSTKISGFTSIEQQLTLDSSMINVQPIDAISSLNYSKV